LTTYWIIFGIILLVIIAAYIVLFFYTRKRQKTFDEQYMSMKERHEVFVLNKKVVRERAKSGWAKYARFKTYQVIGRISISQAVRGIQMSKMQTVTFHATKQEYEKIKVNHKYKMDIAGNYIGYVVAPLPSKDKGKKKPVKPTIELKGKANSKTSNTKSQSDKKVKS